MERTAERSGWIALPYVAKGKGARNPAFYSWLYPHSRDVQMLPAHFTSSTACNFIPYCFLNKALWWRDKLQPGFCHFFLDINLPLQIMTASLKELQ